MLLTEANTLEAEALEEGEEVTTCWDVAVVESDCAEEAVFILILAEVAEEVETNPVAAEEEAADVSVGGVVVSVCEVEVEAVLEALEPDTIDDTETVDTGVVNEVLDVTACDETDDIGEEDALVLESDVKEITDEDDPDVIDTELKGTDENVCKLADAVLEETDENAEGEVTEACEVEASVEADDVALEVTELWKEVTEAENVDERVGDSVDPVPDSVEEKGMGLDENDDEDGSDVETLADEIGVFCEELKEVENDEDDGDDVWSCVDPTVTEDEGSCELRDELRDTGTYADGDEPDTLGVTETLADTGTEVDAVFEMSDAV